MLSLIGLLILRPGNDNDKSNDKREQENKIKRGNYFSQNVSALVPVLLLGFRSGKLGDDQDKLNHEVDDDPADESVGQGHGEVERVVAEGKKDGSDGKDEGQVADDAVDPVEQRPVAEKQSPF